MIYTLTLSPSIDYFIEGKDFALNQVNRFSNFELLPGGKGLNASVVMQRLGFNNHAITFFDPGSLKIIEPILEKEKISIYNIASGRQTRINVKFYGEKQDFELNGPRTILNDDQKAKLYEQIDSLNKDDILLIMGVGDSQIIESILQICVNKEIKFVLDIDSLAMQQYIKYQPFLIKPNKDELKNIFNIDIQNESDVINALKFLKQNGAQNAIISFDAKGSYLIDDKNQIYKCEITKPLERVVSATGAGDTLISTFCAFYSDNYKSEEAFKIASAAAMGTVSQSWLTNKEITDKFLNSIQITKI